MIEYGIPSQEQQEEGNIVDLEMGFWGTTGVEHMVVATVVDLTDSFASPANGLTLRINPG